MKAILGGYALILCAVVGAPVVGQPVQGDPAAADGAAAPAEPSASQTTSDSAARVSAALEQLQQWLGPKAERWNAYLELDALRAELVRGAEADPAVVARSLQRLRSGANGLALPPFVKVERATAAWLDELRTAYGGDLVKLALSARGDYAPITPEQFSRVRGELRRAAGALSAALGEGTALSKTWKSYLQWKLLEPHLSDGFEVDRTSMANLDGVLRRFRANEPGLELPVFQATAKAIARYRALAPWAAAAKVRDGRTDYARVVASLADELRRHIEQPTTETSWKISRLLGVVESLGQSPEFTKALRLQYAKANVAGGVSNSFVQRMPDRPINSQRDVRDCILGVRQVGLANVTGNVRYELLPSDKAVTLAVHIDAVALSQTRGYKGPAVVRASGTTTLAASKNLMLSDESFTSSPGVAYADTRTRIHSISKVGGGFGSRLVTKIGWKRAAETKRPSERIAAQNAERRLLAEFDRVVARDLGDVRQRYVEKIQAPLLRRGVSPEHLKMSSSAEGVAVEATFATRQQLGAAGPPPEMLPGHDMFVQIHESAINNYLPLALASAKIAQETADVAPVLSGDVPNWVKALSLGKPNLAAAASAGLEMVDEAKARLESAVDPEEENASPPGEKEFVAPAFKPYSITLNAEAPATVKFDEGIITIRVRAAKLASDDSEYDDWDFIVRYRITARGDEILLKREGDIEVFPTGFDPAWDKRLTAQQSGFRSTLAKNMNARARAGQSFPAEIPIQPVRLSRFGVLVLQELVADDGWLSIGWVLPAAGAPGALPAAAPQAGG